ncbi:MAG TPA: PIG-L deacetylase family protein [Acidimicrobiales bacterium]|nr:PIG-L deacetylase family protein [Acidimicrobiales bacterium]
MAAELLSAVPTSALAIYAHPDDADVSCGGTLAAWAQAGAPVHLVICTSGDKGSSEPAADPGALVARRHLEVAAAAEVLGLAGVEELGYPDGEVENDRELRARLVGLIRRLRPEVVVCPDPLALFFGEHYYNHRDHRVVGAAALDAACPAAGSPLYFPEQGSAFSPAFAYLSGSLEPGVYVDIGATVGKKAEAILCHASQLGETGEWFREVVSDRAEQAGRAAGVPYAEAFRRIRIAS